VWTFIHPLVGAPAMLVFAIGALLVERSALQRIPTIATANATA
jgi:hypothetical protein